MFSIPCPSHLRKFAEKHFFDGLTAPFPITERESIGKHVMYSLIDKRQQSNLHAAALEYEEILSVELSDTLAKRSPNLLKLSRLIQWLDDQFKNSSLVWVQAQIQMGESRYQAARKFFEYYGIEDDRTFDSLYTYLKRRTNRTYNRIRYEKKLEEGGRIS